MANKKWELIDTTNSDAVLWSYTDEGIDSSIEGILTKITTNIGDNNSTLYEVQTKDELKSFWGCTVLDARIVEIPIGNDIKIVYKGKSTSPKTKRSYHDFEVYTVKKPIIDNDKVEEFNLDLDNL